MSDRHPLESVFDSGHTSTVSVSVGNNYSAAATYLTALHAMLDLCMLSDKQIMVYNFTDFQWDIIQEGTGLCPVDIGRQDLVRHGIHEHSETSFLVCHLIRHESDDDERRGR